MRNTPNFPKIKYQANENANENTNFILVDDMTSPEMGNTTRIVQEEKPHVQEAVSGGGGHIPPHNNNHKFTDNTDQGAKRAQRRTLRNVFLSATAGAMAGCLLFVSLFQGGAWIGNMFMQQPGVETSTSRLPNKTSTNNFADVVEAVSPGVLTVLVNKQQRDYFGQVRNQEGLGSGVVYHVEGNKVYIITNAHVVEGASEIAVYHNELSRSELDIAKVVASDPSADIAVLVVENPKQSYTVTIDFGNSDELKIGEEVFAVGSPMGEEYRGSVTCGIVSGLNRQVPVDNWGRNYQTFIQTDAAINGGNSGGGLIDINGQLIGINSAKLSDADNIGLAIPSNTVLAVLATMDVPQPVVDWEFTNVDNTQEF